MEPLFTVGHSTHPIEEFLRMLEPNGVVRVIDVRAFPRSRNNPQYNEDALPRVLAPRGIAYEHIASLGGKRPRSKDVPEATNAFWDNASFHNYADYAMGADFREGLAALLDRGARERVAFMCAEAVWWRCHRRIVADYLLADDVPVAHIMASGKIDPARLTPGALPQPDGTILYSGEATGSLL